MRDKLSHTTKDGKAAMVDVSNKEATLRTGEAHSEVKVNDEILKAIKENNLKKGDLFSVAQLAGIQAAKKTYEIIPLCHNISINKIDVELKLNEETKSVEIKSFVKTESKTGVEMEALTAASVAALTVYDMCKAIDKSIVIKEIKLISKTGGKSGDFRNINQ